MPSLSRSSIVLIGWAVFAAFAVYMMMPLRKNLKFGIDLVGGTYITLDVQVEKAVEDELNRIAHTLNKRLEKAHLATPVTRKVEGEKLFLTFDKPSGAQEVVSFFKKEEPMTAVSVDDTTVTVALTSSEATRIKNWAVESNVAVLDSRLRKLALEEITISRKGDKSIIVELPDVDDPQKAKAMIGTPAVLEFKIVEEVASSEDELLDKFDGQLPDDMIIIPGQKEDGQYGTSYYLVSTYADITGKLFKDARPGFDGKSGTGMAVHFQFTPEGGKLFWELTSKNVGRALGVVLDGEMISAPRINEPIGSSGQITGNFTPAQVNELSAQLKSGAFAAPVTFEEERRIGPTLGQESIRRGLLACLVGLALLFVFSAAYYKVAGVMAFMALLYNLLVLLFILSQLNTTLTLPGIAGMVLTVGMAIDASVLIYERIKEELAAGLSYAAAVKAGFSDALMVILDANITTFIVGIVLYKFGTGPIQGFAATMMIGIVATLITGLFFLRSLFDFVLNSIGVQRIKI